MVCNVFIITVSPPFRCLQTLLGSEKLHTKNEPDEDRVSPDTHAAQQIIRV